MLQLGNGLTARTDRRTGNTPQICGLWFELLGQANRLVVCCGSRRNRTRLQDGVLFQKVETTEWTDTVKELVASFTEAFSGQLSS